MFLAKNVGYNNWKTNLNRSKCKRRKQYGQLLLQFCAFKLSFGRGQVLTIWGAGGTPPPPITCIPIQEKREIDVIRVLFLLKFIKLCYSLHYSSSLLMVTYLRMFPVLTQSPIRFLPISNFPRTKNLVKCKVALRLEKLVLYRFFVVDR